MQLAVQISKAKPFSSSMSKWLLRIKKRKSESEIFYRGIECVPANGCGEREREGNTHIVYRATKWVKLGQEKMFVEN